MNIDMQPVVGLLCNQYNTPAVGCGGGGRHCARLDWGVYICSYHVDMNANNTELWMNVKVISFDVQ